MARALDRLDLYRRAVDGGVLFPIRRAQWQAAPDRVAFDVTYPVHGGNGAAYDRRLMTAAGPDPRRLLAYMAATFALDRDRPVDVDAFAAAVHAGLAEPSGPAQRRDRRRRALDALAWLADWRPDGLQRVDYSAARGVLTFQRPPLTLLPPDASSR